MKDTIKWLSILVILTIMAFTPVWAQSDAEGNNSNNITVITAPSAYNDGFNIGVQYEHQWNLPYVGGELFIFPDLHGIGYSHIIGRAGVGQEYGNPVGWKWRWNVGFRGGRVFRDGYGGPHALIGLEVGAQVTLPFGLFGKLVWGSDTKSDSAIWNVDHHTVNSVFAGVGVRF